MFDSNSGAIGFVLMKMKREFPNIVSGSTTFNPTFDEATPNEAYLTVVETMKTRKYHCVWQPAMYEPYWTTQLVVRDQGVKLRY